MANGDCAYVRTSPSSELHLALWKCGHAKFGRAGTTQSRRVGRAPSTAVSGFVKAELIRRRGGEWRQNEATVKGVLAVLVVGSPRQIPGAKRRRSDSTWSGVEVPQHDLRLVVGEFGQSSPHFVAVSRFGCRDPFQQSSPGSKVKAYSAEWLSSESLCSRPA